MNEDSTTALKLNHQKGTTGSVGHPADGRASSAIQSELILTMEQTLWSGVLDGCPKSPLVDVDWIRRQCRALRASQHIEHTTTGECVELLGPTVSPFTTFDPSFYLLSNLDVGRSGIHPFLHWLQFGIFEGRAIHPGHRPRPHWAADDGDDVRVEALRAVQDIRILLAEISIRLLPSMPKS